MRNPLGIAAAMIAAIFVFEPAVAQQPNVTQGNQLDMMQRHHRQMMQTTDKSDQRQENMPTEPGQAAFGAIQEIVQILEADPNTDWSSVNLETLRRHLIDMNEVTLNADVVTKPIDGGIEATVTGSGRTIKAIQRMVPAHAHQIDQTHLNGWKAETEPLPNGVVLTVTSADPKEVQHLRGLGFIGFMVSGAHHQAHHLAMAKGEPIHTH
jgi:hypothetical protein